MSDLVVPQLGESITEAVVARWLKQAGDAVAADEPVAELETDKITVQLPSPVAGALKEQAVAVGATVKVGQVIGTVEPGAAGKASAKPAEAKPAEKPAPPPQPQPQPQQTNAQKQQLARAATQPIAQTQGNGQGLDKDALLKLTPSQRVHAREAGQMPRASTSAAPAPSGPSSEA